MPRGTRNDVFVGNIAFGTTDEDIRRIFSEVGRVTNVRMAVNAETGKPRGYCFVEYDDPATALSAIRNLNDRDVGGRCLRVNYSNNSALVDYAARAGPGRGGGGEKRASTLSSHAVVEAMATREVWDVIEEAKALATEGDGEKLAALLSTSGELTDAVVHMLAALGMIRSPPGVVATHPRPGYAPSAAAGPAADLVSAAMKLTPAQLAQLPPDRRAKIEALREKIRASQGNSDMDLL